MQGEEFVRGVRSKLRKAKKQKVTDRQVAGHLGITVMALHNWRKRKEITVRQMVGVLFKSKKQAAVEAENQAIRPIVEFFKLMPTSNRDRSVQQIRRVDHPERRQSFRTSDEKRRQIRLRRVPLHELAEYLSAYQVAEGLIGELESLLIRSFANDLLNVRMENFVWEKRKSRKRQTAKG
jgi:hypothetical protein